MKKEEVLSKIKHKIKSINAELYPKMTIVKGQGKIGFLAMYIAKLMAYDNITVDEAMGIMENDIL